MADDLKTYRIQPSRVETREFPPMPRVTRDAHDFSDGRRFVVNRAEQWATWA